MEYELNIFMIRLATLNMEIEPIVQASYHGVIIITIDIAVQERDSRSFNGAKLSPYTKLYQ